MNDFADELLCPKLGFVFYGSPFFLSLRRIASLGPDYKRGKLLLQYNYKTDETEHF